MSSPNIDQAPEIARSYIASRGQTHLPLSELDKKVALSAPIIREGGSALESPCSQLRANIEIYLTSKRLDINYLDIVTYLVEQLLKNGNSEAGQGLVEGTLTRVLAPISGEAAPISGEAALGISGLAAKDYARIIREVRTNAQRLDSFYNGKKLWNQLVGWIVQILSPFFKFLHLEGMIDFLKKSLSFTEVFFIENLYDEKGVAKCEGLQEGEKKSILTRYIKVLQGQLVSNVNSLSASSKYYKKFEKYLPEMLGKKIDDMSGEGALQKEIREIEQVQQNLAAFSVLVKLRLAAIDVTAGLNGGGQPMSADALKKLGELEESLISLDQALGQEFTLEDLKSEALQQRLQAVVPSLSDQLF